MTNAERLRRAADRHVLPVSECVLAGVGAARRALDLAALEAAIGRQDRHAASQVVDVALAALVDRLGRPPHLRKDAEGEPLLADALGAVLGDAAGAAEVCVVLSKAERAKLAANPARKEWQDRGEANEKLVTDILGPAFRNLDDNEAMDVIGATDKGRAVGVEVKTLIDNKGNKVTMDADAQARKRAWKRKNKADLWTVVVDDRDVTNPGQYSGNKLYARKGVGSFRLSSMDPVTVDELRAMIGVARAQPLTEQAIKDAVQNYTGDSSPINNPLRHGSAVPSGYAADVRALDQAIAETAGKGRIRTDFYRVVPKDFAQSLEHGSTVTDNGFVSTSQHANFLAKMLEDAGESGEDYESVTIKVPNGVGILRVNDVLGATHPFAWQGEWLLGRGHSFTVFRSGGKVTLTLVK